MYAWIFAMTVEVALAAEPGAANTALERLGFIMSSNVCLQVMLTLGG